MMIRWTKLSAALHGIALALALESGALAQNAPSNDDADADCMPSRQAHECADRCPNYDTCFVADDGLLYYRVGEQRFDCDGLDCSAASETLGDYCCQRGAFAPDDSDDGGCALAPGPRPERLAPIVVAALAALTFRRGRRSAARGARGRR